MKKNSVITPAGTTTAAAPERGRRQRVQSATTAVVLLKGLATLGGRASLTALAAYVDESPAKVHRYLVSLMEESLVAQEPLTQLYVLGTECLAIGLAAIRLVDPIRVAEPSLVLLRESLEVTCFVAVMGNRGPTIVRFEEPGLPVTVNVRVGSVMSVLWSATGRVFLGLLDESCIRAMAEDELAHAPADLRGQLDANDPVGRLRAEVQVAQCATVKDTNLKGISAVAAPLFDFNGRLCGTLTALGATGGFDSSINGPIAAAVRREAQAISVRLGYVAETPAA
ncbi:DNA-binding transcriptional repressor YiaJ [Paraburkholderia domus]|uniref:IclR family transcriptional regulator n=1 Tax=Paraburkholderia domus TaxID=2793075 RepID=UPI001914C1CB|nr:IclR family transcriptional regulator [Paraburkholderia domus]MBK5091360.1 IclR family transcriptional regulator [Burkholderia sp. R-69927]CAE6934798.1 DNA-binding transcriptional repressor YiaJ [Paraburkholderia domus]